MQDKQQLIQQLQQYNTDRLAPQRIQHIRAALRLIDQVSYYDIVPGQSKLGGFPDLPNLQAFPFDEQAFPYRFVAQINLATIAQANPPLDLPLPKKGLLSFFVDDRLYEAKVLWTEEIEELKPIQEAPSKFVPFPCQRVTFQRWYTHPAHDQYYKEMLPSPLTFKDKLLGKRSLKPSSDILDEITETASVYDLYYELYGEELEPKHQIGGHYQTLQGNYSLEPDGKPENWYLLLQLDSDSRIDFNWMDGGRLYFFLKKEDLLKQDFSNIHLATDTH